MKWLTSIAIAPLMAAALQAAPSTDAQGWGRGVNGLRIAIAPATAGAGATTGPAFQISFQNEGASDFVVNLGMMLGNGKWSLPTRIQLNLADDIGRTRRLRLLEPMIDGRVDDFIVPLPRGATYSVQISLDDCWDPQARTRTQLPGGTYALTAVFDGQGAASVQMDMKGAALLNFWKGQAQSNTIEFSVGG